jgi:iron complex outermembrane receptor protein
MNSLKSLSILRDGAAAQYGADAVAGVIDLTLDDSEGISGEATFSQYYAGDGFAYNLASKAGISLADRGFLTVTAQYGKTDPTNRADVHLYAVDQIAKWNQQQAGTLGNYVASDGNTYNANDFNGEFTDPAELDPATIAPYGVNEETHFTVTWNSAMEIGESSEVYTFGNFGRKHHKEPFNFRGGFPHGYVPPFGSGNSGASRQVTYGMNDYIYLYGQQAFAENAYLLGLNPDGTPLVIDGVTQEAFAGLNTHPNGYNPWYEVQSQDYGVYAGFRGEFDNGLTYDLSGSIGQSRVDNNISDTHNPSLGGPQNEDGSINYNNIQTQFYIGSQVNIERTVSADFVYTVDTDAVDNINVAFGAQYRSEQYYNVVGEENSWLQGPLAGPNLATFAATSEGMALGLEGGRGLNNSSDGFGGFAPNTFFDAKRHNYAVYLDVDTDVNEDFNIAVAGRYEDFSDFGSAFSWKVASRWQVLPDLLALRGAYSTGFHAPTVAQINNTQVRTGFRGDGSQTQTGAFTADSIPGQVFGIPQVGPELARNLSGGFIFTPGDNTNITVDLFQIKLRDSLSQSATFDVLDYPVEFASILNAGFQGAAQLTGVNFAINEGSRKVRGIEVVATQGFDLENSRLNMTLAFAHVDVTLTDHNEQDRSLFNIEHNTAPYRATFTTNWNMDQFNVMGRARWISTRETLSQLAPDGTFLGNNADLADYRMDKQPGRVFFDLALTYNVNEQFAVTVGADNVLDTYPLEQRSVVDASVRAGRKYINDGMDWQGGKYYARIKANF